MRVGAFLPPAKLVFLFCLLGCTFSFAAVERESAFFMSSRFFNIKISAFIWLKIFFFGESTAVFLFDLSPSKNTLCAWRCDFIMCCGWFKNFLRIKINAKTELNLL